MICIGLCFSKSSDGRSDPGIIGLFILSLPLISTMQFYMGFPLRVISGSLAIPLLNFSGIETTLDGVTLICNGVEVVIDAPCSGVRMGWTASFLCYFITSVSSFSWGKTLLLSLCTWTTVLCGNALRVVALVHIELSSISFPAWWHEAIGLSTFVIMVVIILITALFINKNIQGVNYFSFNISLATSIDKLNKLNFFTYFYKESPIKQFIFIPVHLPLKTYVFMTMIFLASFIALLPSKVNAQVASHYKDHIWPNEYNGRSIQELPLTEREHRFYVDFPGAMKRFSDGEKEIIIKWVYKITRRVHPSIDCFKGAGYQISEPGLFSEQHTIWSSFKAKDSVQHLFVKEQITDSTGQTWSDVSSWYWAAVLGQTKGPWKVTTIAKPIN